MKINKILLVSLLLLTIFTIGAVGATDSTNLTDSGANIMQAPEKVVELDESSAGHINYCLGESGETDNYNFQEIIGNASENDIIEIDCEIEPYNEINIGKNLTLQGNNRNSAIGYSCLNINEGDVTIKNLTFKRSIDNTLIVAKNEKLTFINCTFQYDNAIKFSGKTLTLTDCTFKDNANGISLSGGDVEINNCLFDNIKIQSIVADSSKLIVYNSTFRNCSSGICAENGEAIIRNNKFINTMEFSLSDTITIVENNMFNSSYPSISNPKKCSFKNNTLINSNIGGVNLREISDCNFISSRITAEHCEIINNCTFRNINTEFTLIYNCPNIHITNCTFINNTFLENMFEIGDIFNFHMNDCLFENNTAGNLISGQYFKSARMDNVKFIQNSFKETLINCYESKAIEITNSEFKNNDAKNNLIRIKEVTSIKINSNVISNNKCQNTLYIDYLDYHIEYNDKISTSIEITNNIISGNYNQKNIESKIFLKPKIASNAIQMKWGTNLNLKNNFYGYNILKLEELSFTTPLKFDITVKGWQNLISPTNVEINGNTIRFVDLNGNPVKMPKYAFSIKNIASNEIIVSDILTDNGQGDIKSDADTSNSYIINEEGGIVNKPKASITFAKKGSRYDNFALNIYLKHQSSPITYKNLKYTVYIYTKSGKLIEKIDDTGKTDSAGKLTIKTFPADYSETIDYFSVKVTFASEKYAFSQKNIKNIKISKIKTTVKALKITNKYKKSQYFQITVKNQANGQAVKNTYIKLKIAKKTYTVKTNKQGIAKFNTKNLKIGKHTVTISSKDQRYSISAKSTIVIKK